MTRFVKAAEILLLSILSYCFLFQSEAAAEGAAKGFSICAASVAPGLFPFFFLTDCIVSAGYVQKISVLTAPFMEKIYHLPGETAAALLLGCIGGYPVGVKVIAQLYSQEQITSDQAAHCLRFCSNAGPAFAISILGGRVFQSTFIGILLYIIHIVSAFILGVIFRPKQYFPAKRKTTPSTGNASLSIRWTASITNAGTTMILVCTYIIFFSILLNCVGSLLPNKMAGTLPMIILTALSELAGGASAISASALTPAVRFILCSAVLGFSGLCVMLQSYSILQSAGLEGSPLIQGKIVHGLLSGIIAASVSKFIPFPLPCAAYMPSKYSILLPQWAIFGLLILFVFIFLKKTSGIVEKNRI